MNISTAPLLQFKLFSSDGQPKKYWPLFNLQMKHNCLQSVNPAFLQFRPFSKKYLLIEHAVFSVGRQNAQQQNTQSSPLRFFRKGLKKRTIKTELGETQGKISTWIKQAKST